MAEQSIMRLERVPSQLFENSAAAAEPTGGAAMTDKRNGPPLAHDAPVAAPAASAAASLAPFPLATLPFASLRVPALPLLSRGVGNSLSLIHI